MTAFWGEDWRRQITIVTTGTDEEFRALAGGRQEFAAATTVDRIVFAPPNAKHTTTTRPMIPSADQLAMP